ncbi:MAG: hypothetical protein PHQ24_12425 [Proteiniphilum sp.]|nr:hypothetical protein [Proteiniphilum sp.]
MNTKPEKMTTPQDFKIVAATPYFKEEGCYDTRLVVVAWLNRDGTVKEYSRSYQTTPNEALFWSRYYTNKADAMYGAQCTIEKNRHYWKDVDEVRLVMEPDAW